MLILRLGPALCGKTEQLLADYRDALSKRPPGASLWLAPTWRAAAEVRLRLFDRKFRGCFAPGVMTFAQFAETVLHGAGVPIRPINGLMKRELVRQIIEEQAARGRLKHFQAIAATGGLVDLVSEFISELKRLEIWPENFHQACSSRGIGDKDVELAEIYEAYQQALREHRLFDAEGRFWSARDVLAKKEGLGTRDGAANTLPSFLVIDGFTDFTRTQHEIIEILARCAETTLITLPLEPSSQRTDLFAKPLKTLAELQRRHANHLRVEEVARPQTAVWPAIRHLEQSLFINPRDRKTSNPPAPSGLEILAAARQAGEVEWIAARIKRLLVDGHARPGDIAVVFRSPQDIGGLLNEVFRRAGIPAVFESGQSLDGSPALRALAALMQLHLDDWPFEQLLAVLGNNYFQPHWPEWQNGRVLPEIERAIRTQQIPNGRERLLEQLREPPPKGDKSSFKKPLAVLERLAKVFDALPEQATLPEWADVWQKLAEATGLLRAMDEDGERIGVREQDVAGGPPPETDNSSAIPHSANSLSDHRAWARFLEVLTASNTLADWIGRRPPALDCKKAVDAMSDILRSERIGHAGDESGCVRVLSASSIRSLRIPYLFLAGLSEKAFPPPDREDRLYSEAEYSRLIEAGLPFVARTERTREEMLLFYEAVTRATKRLYFSYPALDDAAQPLLPSPFLREVEDAFGDARVPRIERVDLRPIPTDAEPVDNAAFRIKAMDMALNGNVALLASLLREGACPLLVSGLGVIHQRQDREAFGPTEGMLQSSESHCYLAVRYPQSHSFAATDLERYASCPFRFFLERVLKIEPIEDLALDFDVLERGSTVHDVMAKFHHRVNERLGRVGSPLQLEPADYDALLNAALAEALPAESKNPLQSAMREIDRRLIVQWVSHYRTQLEQYDALWTNFETPMAAELLEVSFGRGNEQPPSIPLSLDFSRGNDSVRIAGRIDRIDTGVVAGQAVFNILDYKTGGPIKCTPETIQAGLTLQLPIYALAAMELLLIDRDAIPWHAGYWYVRDAGFQPKKSLRMYRNDDGRIELETLWEEIRDSLDDIVVGLVQAIRKGRFPVCSADDECTGRCQYNTICRVNQVRSLEKKWQPTDMQ